MIGHVDHGKTSLTKALTGKWTDTHSEELKKGISIRLGYADAVFRKCPNCQGSEAYTTKPKCELCGNKANILRKVSFVDAPGHETLMATMLSGAALMDGAILVIAANEPCPQPRTVEHLLALSIGGTKKIVVAQNKIDLVSREKAIEHYNAIKKFLEEFGFKDVPIIPVSANFNTNIDLLIEAIEQHIPTPKRIEGKELKMFVARSFDINKPGTEVKDLKGGVLGGAVIQGSIKLGQEIDVSPGLDGKQILTKVVSLATATGQLDEAKQGGLIAIGTSLDPSITRNDQMRGQVVGDKGKLPKPVMNLLLEVHEFKRLTDEQEKLQLNDLVILNAGTATALGQIARLKGSQAELRLKNPMNVWPGDMIAISKKRKTGWRLTAYGINK